MTGNTMNLISLAEELELLIRTTVPEVQSLAKYGGTLFTLKPDEKEGQFCGIFIYKNHVQISFSKGAQLTDPAKLLEGSGKLRRHMNFIAIDDVNHKSLEALLVQSSRL